jgi:hypothetical protein
MPTYDTAPNTTLTADEAMQALEDQLLHFRNARIGHEMTADQWERDFRSWLDWHPLRVSYEETLAFRREIET